MGTASTGDYPGLRPPLNSEKTALLSVAARSITGHLSLQIRSMTSIVLYATVTDINRYPADSNYALIRVPWATETHSKNIGATIESGWRNQSLVTVAFLLV